MNSAHDRARVYSGWALLAAFGTSIAFAFALGKSPVMKLVLFLLGLAIWHGILTYIRERLADGGRK